MSKQLRLVDTPRRSGRGRSGGARTGARTGRRAVRWPDWKLDPKARTIGREGVAQARAALARAAQTDPAADPSAPEQEDQLPRAS